jgi:lipoprotein signal peptidase
MQNHLTAILILASSLIAFVYRPSLGLLAVITGGLWNVVDYWPDKAVYDPYVLGNVAFNLADIAILFGFLLLVIDLGTTLRNNRR